MKRLVLILSVLFVMLAASPAVNAQCSMCQATAESSRDAGSSNSEGINKGVMYLFFTPYLIIGTIGYFWWRSRKKQQEVAE
ncbi:MAG: hypothetical protein RLZZ367_504 [Bacteroidota bacterium]|jgi:hypothetical protein